LNEPELHRLRWNKSVTLSTDSGEDIWLTSYAHTDDDQKVTSVTADILHYAATNFNINTNK
jgi:hypothetical protein